jgi:hypothetical protein
MKVNPFGIVAGILTVTLPSMGYWWSFRVGDALIFSFSPFDVSMVVMGERIVSPMIDWLCLAFTAIILISGFSLILGSLNMEKWWAQKLIRFGSTKVFWFVISLLLGVSFMALFMSKVAEIFNLPITFDLPFMGSKDFRYELDGMAVSFTTFSNFTQSFGIACITSLLGLASRFYIKGKGK